MACASLAITRSSPGNNSTTHHHHSLCRSYSYKDFKSYGGIRRSYSDNHLCYSINRNRASTAEPKLKNSHSTSMFSFQMFPNRFLSILSDPEASQGITTEEEEDDQESTTEVKRANWLERLMEIRSQWIQRKGKEQEEGDGELEGDCGRKGEEEEGCEVEYGDELVEEDGNVRIDSESFTRLLSTVSSSDARFLARLAFLSNTAYVIQDLKANDLKRKYGLRFVTSSLEKKVAAAKSKLNGDSSDKNTGRILVVNMEKKRQGRPAVAYENIAASAASYVQCQGNQVEEPRVHRSSSSSSKVAAFVAASTMTVVVASGEKEKQEAAKDLRSLHSSPCEWFICDDPNTYTRCFIIQGSDSLASWQTNLFFEPTQFEGRDVLVHRGIYEAAKGIYEQFMDDIMDHLNRYGERAKLQFTGHSLGGSLSLLVHLMLLTRGVVKPNALRPVVTFGSPFVFCGGQRILNELGLNEDCVHCVIMHRDIVPRAFTCNYPPYAAHILRRLNANFRSHPCLNKNRLLYSPLGKIFILQPDHESSPRHPLLPPGIGLYALDHTEWCSLAEKALRDFLNFPHPLETLSDPTAYGAEGTILRDHDSGNYLKAINGYLNKQTGRVYHKVRKQRTTFRTIITSQISSHNKHHEYGTCN